MKTKLFACIGGIAFGVLSGSASAVTIGTYNFADADLADQANLTIGQVWDSKSNAYTTTPAALTDTDATTYASTYPDASSTNNVTIDLGFGQTQIANGDGADIALFFLSEQSTNVVNVTIGTASKNNLLFSTVYNEGGIQQVAFGLASDQVWVSVIEINLDDYGFDPGEAMNDMLSMNLVQNDSAIAVSLSLAGSLNSTVIPVPAAVWLFGSGLIGLVGVARRKK